MANRIDRMAHSLATLLTIMQDDIAAGHFDQLKFDLANATMMADTIIAEKEKAQ